MIEFFMKPENPTIAELLKQLGYKAEGCKYTDDRHIRDALLELLLMRKR